MAYFPFSGWGDSFFGDLHGQGRHGVEFYTETKVVIERWPSAGYVEAPWEVDRLLDATDSGRVGLCYDTGHLVLGGADPLAVLARHGDRVWHVHFKDCHPQVAAQSRAEAWDYFAAVRHGVFCELGRGAVDFAAVVAALERRGYEGWVVVEQDVLPGLGTPAQSAGRNRDFLRSLGL
jgi:inosose dehydratase